jgi:hypothetical protein
MATFGNSAVAGATTEVIDFMLLVQGSPVSNGTLASFSTSIRLGSAGMQSFRGALYSYDSSTSGTLLAVSQDISFSNTSTTVLTANFVGANAIGVSAGTNYWIALQGAATSSVSVNPSATPTYAGGGYISEISTSFSAGAPTTFTGSSRGGTYPYVTAYITYNLPTTLTGVSSITGLQSITF